MNTRIRLTPFVVVLALAIGALALAPATALAQKPVKSEFPWQFSGSRSDICGFEVQYVGNANITEIDFFDRDGSLNRMELHIAEQDTFTANGKQLVSMPFAYNFTALVASDGSWTQVHTEGVSEKIWLPDGRLFAAAGRIDWVANGFPAFILSPDSGNPGNVAGFCAALAK
jgi:hypothetical protein